MPTGLLIVDHGSTHSEANRMLEKVAELVRVQAPGLIVHTAHMELAEPSIRTGFSACVSEGADNIVVHPYMLSPGRHATSDIPRLVSEVSASFPDVPYTVTPPLGLHEKISEVILERSGLR